MGSAGAGKGYMAALFRVKSVAEAAWLEKAAKAARIRAGADGAAAFTTISGTFPRGLSGAGGA